MDEDRARALATDARVARLATIADSGAIDLVPIVFALDDDLLYSAVDHKPKSTPHLGRLHNIRARPEVTVLIDHYEDAWDRLWWVRLRGPARVVEAGLEHEVAVAALVEKYAQYACRPPVGDAIVVEVRSWRGWQAVGG